jgi:hypothetical protein
MKNLTIDKKKGKAELELSCDFYPEQVVKKAAEDFGKAMKISIEKRGRKMIVRLDSGTPGGGVEKAAFEFLNYLLAEVKNGAVKL